MPPSDNPPHMVEDESLAPAPPTPEQITEEQDSLEDLRSSTPPPDVLKRSDSDYPYNDNPEDYQYRANPESPRFMDSLLGTASFPAFRSGSIGDRRKADRTIAGMLAKSKRFKRRPMLTSAQLSAMFSRLDKDGDGELDLDEFTGIIKMLHIRVSPDYIAKVFQAVDRTPDANENEATGTLDMQEFISAYQLIYSGSSDSRLRKLAAEKESFARATRYGVDATGQHIFECYTMPGNEKKGRFKYTLDMPEEDFLKHSSRDLEDRLARAHKVDWEGTLADIGVMMKADGAMNARQKTKILWWVDASYAEVNRSVAEDLVAKMGLPNNSKFLSSFSNFGTVLGSDSKRRMYCGRGEYSEGTVCSLNFFAQSMWLSNRPVVHHLPAWIDQWRWHFPKDNFVASTLASSISYIEKYYKSRFAWMFNLTWLSSTAADERAGSLERASNLAEFIKDGGEEWNSDDSSDSDDDDVTEIPPQNTLFSSRGGAVPLHRRAQYIKPGTWLLSNSHLQALPPRMKMDTISFHILDHGYGAHALLTVREMDSERQKRLTSEQKSRTGILGRIMSGAWVRLAEVTMLGGGADVTGELADSPASLVTLLQLLIHNFSMDSSTAIGDWLKLLEKEIKDVVVSKHSAHLIEAERVVKDFVYYVEPLDTLYRVFAKEQQEELQAEFQAQTLRQAEANATNAASSPVAAIPTHISLSLNMPRGSHYGDTHDNCDYSEASGSMVDRYYREAVAHNIEKVPLSFALIKHFLGDDPYRELRTTLDGYELLDVKGLIYWKDRLKKYGSKIEGLKSLISAQLDEKRNFMSFMLTIITTVLAPLAILTSYFGMNFDNMKELDSNTYPNTPGIVLMWVITGSAYAFLLFIALHFRILYSAT